MPVKLLLADKSITIQKVVEMLFSGRDYEVVCVSDGDAALNEAARVVPDVALVDVDLPRIDGYTLAARLKQDPKLAQTPVILMMSRDDVYDGAKGKQAGILDSIAKPFESQELIGKVKKALAAAPPRLAEPAPPTARRPLAPSPPAPAAPAKPKKAAPTDIFEIINEAPTQADLARAAAPDEEESVFEVEPVVEEVEGPLARESAKALPIGAKAVEEMRAGLGLTKEKEEPQPEIVTAESLEMALKADQQAEFRPKTTGPLSSAPRPLQQPVQPPMSEKHAMAEEAVAKTGKQVFEHMPSPQLPMLSASEVWGIAEETVAKMAKDVFAQMPSIQPSQGSGADMRSMVEEMVSKSVKEALEKASPSPATELPIPKISEETVRRGIEEAVMRIAREVAHEVIEKVAWEVIPQLAEIMIKEEIERLKAEP